MGNAALAPKHVKIRRFYNGEIDLTQEDYDELELSRFGIPYEQVNSAESRDFFKNYKQTV